MKSNVLYPRYLRPRIEETLADSPVVLLHGPRQCGKTTRVRLVGDEKGFTYFTFDDDVQRAAAQADPVGYVADLPKRAVLDEVQRVPELFTSLKVAVDTRREPGRFILTGSANARRAFSDKSAPDSRVRDLVVANLSAGRTTPLAQQPDEASG